MRPSALPARGPSRRVSERIVASYAALMVAFALTVGLGLRELRAAAEESEVLRAALVPLEIHVGQALAEQGVLSTQLNHVASAKNPADVRAWIDAARRARPVTIAAALRAVDRLGGDSELDRFRTDIVRELEPLQAATAADGERLGALFDALARGDANGALQAQGELVRREAEVARRLRAVKDRTEVALERVRDRARSREKSALVRMVALGAISLLVGVALSLYARRALAPLAMLTRRANEVASGDLAPREAPRDATEIGELGRTFEAMVRSVRDARAELVKAERLAVVGQMAAKITHEVRNPLSAIGLNLELLEADLAEREGDVGEARELCVAMQREVQRLTQLSQQYLSLARRPAPELVPEPLGDLVAEVVAFLKPELDRGGVRAELELDPSAPPVALDEGLLRQALHNLLRNAREAMPDGGTIRVRLRAAEGGGVDLAIEDEGEGVPDALRATIFDPFVTTKSGGTGLGLAVTREIVEAHGGLVACEPREPRGTRFALHFPSALDAPRRSSPAPSRDDQSGTG